MEQLVVRLGSNATDPVHWLVWSTSEKEIIASGELSDATQLASLSERAGQRPITALVPSSDVYLTWLSMPAKAARKAMAAIPFMLEEELSGDISEQFFATGQRQGDQQAVAAVKKDKMQLWLTLIQQAGLYCDKLIPDVHAVPLEDDGWSLICLGQQAIVRQDAWMGLQGHLDWVLPSMEFLAKQQEEPLNVANYSEQSLENLANIEPLAKPLDVTMQVLAEGALNCKFNLLQGEFTVKRKPTGQWQHWRLAGVLAALALLTTLVDKGLEISQLNGEKERLDSAIHAEVTRAFPDVTRYRNVRNVVNQKLAALGDSGGSNSVLMMMSRLSEAFTASQVKPQTLRFDRGRGEIRLQAEAASFEKLEQFKRMAQEQGFSVEEGAINNRDNGVVGSLVIRG